MLRTTISIGVITLLLLSCEPEGGTNNCTGDECNNIINNINNANVTCTGTQDNKLTQLHFLSTKIHNGVSSPGLCVPPTQQRATVALLREEGPVLDNFCSGTLVSDYHVLTAAHCVVDAYGNYTHPSEIWVGFGQDMDNPDAIFEVENLTSNPDYSYFGDETGFDHAVLVLKESPLDTLDVEPIPINRGNMDFLVGRYVQQVGYGTTESDLFNTLRWWTVELVARVDEALGELTVNGQGESSVCGGDSGGPSLYPLGGSGVSIVGTVSWGDESCVDFDYYAMTSWDTAFLDPLLPDYDYCGEITSGGTCQDNMARWCQDGVVHTECCDESTGPCQVVDGIAQCQSSRPTCPATLDFKGTCEDNVATWCFGGRVHRRDCTACGQVCQNTRNSTIGYYCITP